MEKEAVTSIRSNDAGHLPHNPGAGIGPCHELGESYHHACGFSCLDCCKSQPACRQCLSSLDLLQAHSCHLPYALSPPKSLSDQFSPVASETKRCPAPSRHDWCLYAHATSVKSPPLVCQRAQESVPSPSDVSTN